MTLINPLLGSNFSSKFDTTLIEDSVWLDGTADYFDGPSFSAQANPTCFTFATWVFINKFSIASLGQYLWSAERSGNYASISFNAANKLVAYSNPALFTSDMVFRDVGWYHIICSFKGPDNTVEMFVNGVQINNTTSSTLASNLEPVHAAHTHRIGAYYVGATGSTLFPANSYLSQTVFLDGQSTQDSTVSVTDFLDTFEFGTNGSQFGPKSNADITALAANSFGTNSYALDFSDSANLGHDSRPHNFLNYSEAFDSWTAIGTTVTANDKISPLGEQVADKIAATASGANQSVTQTVTVPGGIAGKTITTSVYVYADSSFNFTIRTRGNGSTQEALNTTVSTVSGEWTRVSVTRTFTGSADGTDLLLFIYTGVFGVTNSNTYWLFGAQHEQGTLGTYVPTPKNLLLRTEEFDNSYWTKLAGSTATANQTVAPDGTTTADLMTAGNSVYGGIAARRYVSSSSIPANTSLTASIYCKKINHRYIGIRLPSNIATLDGLGHTYTFFDFDTASFTEKGTLDSTSVETLPNDWYRIAVTGTMPSTVANTTTDFALVNSTGNSGATPAGTETVYFWGAQLETGGLSAYRKISSTAAINVVPNNFTPTSITAVNQSSNTPSLTYAMWNPLQPTNSTLTLSEGNLRAAGSVGSDGGAISTIPLATSGTSEFQVKANNGDGRVGIIALDNASAVSIASDNCGGGSGINFDASYQYSENGGIRQVLSSGSSDVQSGIGNWSTNDIITVRYNADDNELNFLKNNSAVGSTVATVAGLTYYAVVSRHNNYDITAYFDSADFPHTIGSGNLEINSANQPTPTLQGVDNFSVSLGTEAQVAPTKNIIYYSEDLTTTSWADAATVTADQAPNPLDGVISADLVARSATNGKRNQIRSGIISGATYIYSMYCKNISVSTGVTRMIAWESVAAYAGLIYITWTNNVPAITYSTNTTGVPVETTIESLSDGWYRIALTVTANNSNNLSIGIECSTAGTGESLYIWGQQFELANDYSGKIDDSGSTVTGNMTNGGGLSAIFDLDTTKNNSQAASGANTNSNDSFVVVDHGSAKTIEQFVAYASTDAQGFDGDSGASTITFTLAGSTDNFSSSNVALFTGTVADGAGAVHTVSTGITRGAYRYHKMTVQTQTLNANEKFGRLAQLEFYEGATAPSTYVPTYTSGFASLPSTHKLDLIDTTTTENYLRNNTMEGAVAGTPGTAPTGWGIIANGTTVELVGSGVTDDGIEYVDYKFSGTPTYGDPWMYFQDGASIPALAGETWTYSTYLALVAGSFTNLASGAEIVMQIIGRNSAGSYVSFGGEGRVTPTSALVRHAFTGTLSGATVTRVSNKIIINWDGSGAIDATFRIGNPQMEKRSSASQVIKTSQYTMNHNLILQSQTMDNAAWVKVSCAVSTNVAVAPDGTTTAEGIQALNSSSSEKRVQQGIASVPSGTYLTASFYVKAARLSFVAVTVYDSIARVVRKFVNLSNGAIGSSADDNSPQEPTFNVESVGNGWYRISAGQRTVGTGTVTMRVQPAASDGNLAYSASESNVDEIYVWGAQLEKTFNSPRTYLPTTTEAVYEPTKRTSLNSFVEIQKNRDATETWAWRFSHDYDKEYAVSTTSTYQDIRDQTGTNNWVSYGLKIAEASGTAAGAVSHGFATGNTVVTHGLASSRYAVLLFPRNGGDVYVYHPDVTTGELLILNSSAADAASNRIRDVTTTTFSIESGATQGVYDYLVLDDNGSSSALGKYIGNASASGPYISTGHRPRWLWIKRIDVANSWVLQDTARHTFNPVDSYLQAESDSAETLTTGDVDFLADGFKIRTASGNAWNATGGSYAYISLGDISGNGDLPPIYGR